MARSCDPEPGPSAAHGPGGHPKCRGNAAPGPRRTHKMASHPRRQGALGALWVPASRQRPWPSPRSPPNRPCRGPRVPAAGPPSGAAPQEIPGRYFSPARRASHPYGPCSSMPLVPPLQRHRLLAAAAVHVWRSPAPSAALAAPSATAQDAEAPQRRPQPRGLCGCGPRGTALVGPRQRRRLCRPWARAAAPRPSRMPAAAANS
mmetsp:Transcript_45089/g.143646  ORF Transcript_45089/g.143646 Transcript_45089/m.143646 type:complete len:204 (+) Transcript_45089:792-1403(+)